MYFSDFCLAFSSLARATSKSASWRLIAAALCQFPLKEELKAVDIFHFFFLEEMSAYASRHCPCISRDYLFLAMPGLSIAYFASFHAKPRLIYPASLTIVLLMRWKRLQKAAAAIFDRRHLAAFCRSPDTDIPLSAFHQFYNLYRPSYFGWCLAPMKARAAPRCSWMIWRISRCLRLIKIKWHAHAILLEFCSQLRFKRCGFLIIICRE